MQNLTSISLTSFGEWLQKESTLESGGVSSSSCTGSLDKMVYWLVFCSTKQDFVTQVCLENHYTN